MLSRNIETFIGCDASFDEADIVLFGAPFDSTTSYRPGTRFGPSAIRHESFGLETYSPYQDKDLTDYKIFDSGDLELCFGNTAKVLDAIRERAALILNSGKLPFLIGGEHLVTLGSVGSVVKKYPDLHIIHFDAHADLRDDYLGEKLSHACVLRRCHELVGDNRIFQFGIRSGDRSEFQWSQEGHTFMQKFTLEGIDRILEKIQGAPVYFTIDLDVLDSSCFPGTGTPEAGGIDFITLIEAIKKVCEGSNIVGCDLVELSPALDISGSSTALACKVTREFLLALQSNNRCTNNKERI